MEPIPYDKMPNTPIAAVTSEEVRTGAWRTIRPVIDLSKCVKCNICWKYCPDVSIKLREDGYPQVDYDHCKGCGICAAECPVKAIKMVQEEK